MNERSFLQYLEFSTVIECVSDIHIGTGDSETLVELRGEKKHEKSLEHIKKKQNEKKKEEEKEKEKEKDYFVQTIVRDFGGKPYIPASSIKGVFSNRHQSEALFGKQASQNKRDDMGAGANMFIWGGKYLSPPEEEPTKLPFWDEDKGTYIDTHNVIDAKTGATEDKKLFFVEYVPQGTKFEISGCIYASLDDAENELNGLVKSLTQNGGFKLGGKQSKRGSVKLISDKIKANFVSFDPSEDNFYTDEETEIDIPSPTHDAQEGFTILDLSTNVPFIIGDPIGYKGKDNEPDKTYRKRTENSLAEMTAEAVRQNLRGICAFLERSQTFENRNKVDDKDYKLANKGDIKNLTSTQRLFGVSGFAGLVEIVAIKAKGPNKDNKYAGIKIDQFTQGVINGAVFTVEAALEQKYEVQIRLDDARLNLLIEEQKEADKELFEALLEEIKADGIRLGAHSGTGFGWFDVDIKSAPSSDISKGAKGQKND